MGTLWHTCVKMCEANELPFGLVSEDGVVRWGPHLASGREGFWGVYPL